MTAPGPWHWQRPISRDLSNTLMGDGRIVLRCIDISQKNAAIVAAAPDMLAALQALMSDPSRKGLLTDTVMQARAAIARATGKD